MAFLGTFNSESDLYLARADEVDPYRPILQGDVFHDVLIPGVELDYEHAMVIAHPCSMRRGPDLVPRIQMLPVTSYEDVPFRRWPTDHPRVFPLRNLTLEDRHFAASFLETGMVTSSELASQRRVATLTERGILVLQQRYVHYLTRAVMQLEQLEEVCGHVLAEAELLEDWNVELVARRVEFGEGLDAALLAEAHTFHGFLTALSDEFEPTLQKCLEDRTRRGDVRRRVRQEILRRAEAAHGND